MERFLGLPQKTALAGVKSKDILVCCHLSICTRMPHFGVFGPFLLRFVGLCLGCVCACGGCTRLLILFCFVSVSVSVKLRMSCFICFYLCPFGVVRLACGTLADRVSF